MADADEVMRRVGDEAWIEDKYDGIRAQLHLEAGGTPRLFSRDLNDVTRSFPEIVEAAQRSGGRGTARDRRRARPVARGIGARLRLAPDPARPGAAVAGAAGRGARSCSSRSTCSTTAGGTCSRQPLRERRAALEALSLPERTGERVLLSHLATARSADEVDRHFDDARERHNEGLMVKDPDSTYQPGRRGLGWLKLKKALATLDCVVVGVEWGHGKRRGVL